LFWNTPTSRGRGNRFDREIEQLLLLQLKEKMPRCAAVLSLHLIVLSVSLLVVTEAAAIRSHLPVDHGDSKLEQKQKNGAEGSQEQLRQQAVGNRETIFDERYDQPSGGDVDGQTAASCTLLASSSRAPEKKNKLKRRVLRSVDGGNDDNSAPVFYYNNRNQLKRLLQELDGESKYGRQNQIDFLRAVSKLSRRADVGSDTAEDSADVSFAAVGDGRVVVKRQPLDRIDEPSRWREKLKPKFGRSTSLVEAAAAAPLDRIDEPNSWRGKMVPKLVKLSTRQFDRLDEPRVWRQKLQPKAGQNRQVNKRQPLDRIDEPSEWRGRLMPKLNRYGKAVSDRGDAAEDGEDLDEEMQQMMMMEKRQPLDRIDEPSEWRVKLVPKYNQLKRRTKNN
jgi:hypothetical protein